MPWVCWPGETPFPTLPLAFVPRVPHTVPVVMAERALSQRDGRADWKRLGEEGPREQLPPKAPTGCSGKDQASVSQSWESFAHPAQEQRFLFLLPREMCQVSRVWCCSITECLLELLSQGMADWELPAMALLVEVSPMGSAAPLSCLPPLCPLTAAAAWDGARALCCCLGPALCGSELLHAGHPALCFVPFSSCTSLTLMNGVTASWR